MKCADIFRDLKNLSLAVVGAGGKSSYIFRLAQQLSPPLVITTTTHLWYEQALLGDKIVLIKSSEDLVNQFDDLLKDRIVVCKPGIIDGRVSGPDPENLQMLAELIRERNMPLLIEADGSRMHPLKAQGINEPNIPSWVNIVVVVVGLSIIGQPLNPDWVHRSELFASLVNMKMGDEIIIDNIVDYLLNPNGGLKNIPIHAKKYALLNQADTDGLLLVGVEIAKKLTEKYDGIMVGKLNSPDEEILSIIEPSAGIVMAAGGSSRMGFAKQLLEWRGIPLVRHMVQTALKSELDRIVVVVGADKDRIVEALEGLPVDIVINDDWAAGQSSSVKAGTEWARGIAGCAIFIPCDQPFITPGLINSLLAQRRTHYSSIVSPVVKGKRTSPVLFGSDMFTDLMSLSGDMGGRVLLKNHPVDEVTWDDVRLLLDIDTREDYQKLLNLDNAST